MEIPVLSYLLEPGFEPWQVSVEPEHLHFPPHLHFKASPATTPNPVFAPVFVAQLKKIPPGVLGQSNAILLFDS